MIHLSFRFKVLFISLFLGILITSSIFTQTDNRLNGRWITEANNITGEYRFDNGNYETFVNGMPSEKGTYSTIAGEIILKITHMHGKLYNELILPQMGIAYSNFNSDWYTFNDFFDAFRKILLIGMTEEQVDWIIEYVISTSSNNQIPYTVDDNTLTLKVAAGNQSMVTVFKRIN